MSVRSCEAPTELLRSKDVVEFKDLQAALGNASRATTFRYLKRVSYRRSYNHNGRYYTRPDRTRYDEFGLFSYSDIHFSRDGTVGETIKRLVYESTVGLTSRELQDVLHLRVQVFLLSALRHAAVTREKIGGFYVYAHTDNAVRELQLHRRREQLDDGKDAPVEARVDDAVIIAVLLTLLRHTGSTTVEVVRYLRGRLPPISRGQVDKVFTRFDLESIGKKGAARTPELAALSRPTGGLVGAGKKLLDSLLRLFFANQPGIQ